MFTAIVRNARECSIVASLKSSVLAVFRRIRIWALLSGKRSFVTLGKGCHVGANARLWAPDHIFVGDNVYLGKDLFVEANISVGDNCLIANQVAFVGKHDHDFKEIGVPVRFSTWIGDVSPTDPLRKQEISVGEDVWIGFRSTLLTGVSVGKGAIIAAGSLVVSDVRPYSIVAGVPAKEVGKRFDKDERVRHEWIISHGEFQYSLKGLKFSKIKPGAPP